MTEFTRLSCTEVGSEPSGFETLLTGFVEAEKLVRAREVAEAKDDEANFGRLLEGYDDVFRRWRERQVTVAEDFNLVDLLGLVRDENRHSDVLAWLLDADVYRATHSQGNRGFRAFLREVGLPEHYANGDYRVGREIQGGESRVDIEVVSLRRFVLHIEVKIGAGEGKAQLERERGDLKERARRFDVVEEADIHAFYLTPGGDTPSHPAFKPISWNQMAHVFEEFAKEAKAESVRWFAGHYALALCKFVVQRREEEARNA